MIHYSKILLLNDDGFNDYRGGGITLKNLFQGWPLDKIAVAHWNDSKPWAHIATNYYKLGYLESHFIFPLNYISSEPKGNLNGHYTPNNHIVVNSEEKLELGIKRELTSNFFKRIFLRIISTSGLSEIVHPLKTSPQFIHWVKEFNPDIIYCQCGDLGFINIVLQTQKVTNARVVVHIMDDWPSTIYKNKSLGFLLRPLVKSRFKKILKLAFLRLGISKAMAEEFGKRYHVPFDYFHNPIDTARFNEISANQRPKDDDFLVVYAGRLGIASYDSIIEFSKCVEELRKEGTNIRFHIYTELDSDIITFCQFAQDGTFMLPTLKDSNFREKLCEADLLLYPVDFDAKSIEYIRLSFPTKLPSYLISGVPVLCYGPPNVHSIQVMEQNDLGFVCAEQDHEKLKRTLSDAITNDKHRKLYSENATEFAKNHFERESVVRSFHQKINQPNN